MRIAGLQESRGRRLMPEASAAIGRRRYAELTCRGRVVLVGARGAGCRS